MGICTGCTVTLMSTIVLTLFHDEPSHPTQFKPSSQNIFQSNTSLTLPLRLSSTEHLQTTKLPRHDDSTSTTPNPTTSSFQNAGRPRIPNCTARDQLASAPVHITKQPLRFKSSRKRKVSHTNIIQKVERGFTYLT